MKNLGALLKFDMRVIVTYWRWLLVFLVASLLLSSGTQDDRFVINGYNFMIIFIMMFATITAFPFEDTDKYNLNVMYSTLPSTRKTQVTSRYLFYLVSMAAIMVVALGIGLGLNAIFLTDPIDWTQIGLLVALGFLMYMIQISFQTPFMYKVGYQKGKIAMWIPVIIFVAWLNLPGVLNLAGVANYNDFNMFFIALRDIRVTSIVSVVIGLVFLVGSYFICNHIHQKRDF